MLRSEEFQAGPTLRDLIVPGPVERGLYFMDATTDTASRIQDRIVDLLWWDSVAAPGTMPGCLPGRQALRFSPLADRVARRGHRRYSRLGSLFWIDTGRAFNMASLMSQARMRGLDSGRVARAVHVQHPVGALPYLEALERIPNAALCALGDSASPEGPTVFSRDPEGDIRPPNSVWWTPLVVISDLMGPLNDARLPADDRAQICGHVLNRLAHLRERAVVLALIQPQEKDRLMLSEFLRLGSRVVGDRRSLEPVLLREPEVVSAGETWH